MMMIDLENLDSRYRLLYYRSSLESRSMVWD